MKYYYYYTCKVECPTSAVLRLPFLEEEKCRRGLVRYGMMYKASLFPYVLLYRFYYEIKLQIHSTIQYRLM